MTIIVLPHATQHHMGFRDSLVQIELAEHARMERFVNARVTNCRRQTATCHGGEREFFTLNSSARQTAAEAAAETVQITARPILGVSAISILCHSRPVCLMSATAGGTHGVGAYSRERLMMRRVDCGGRSLNSGALTSAFISHHWKKFRG